ncbi:hypothetical protein D9M70_512900 [compost metagenome]
MDDTGPLEAKALQGGDHRRMAAPHMQQHRQFELRRQGQLGLEQLLLRVAVQFGDEVVQADLAHGAELGMTGVALQPLAQFHQVLGAVLRQVDRVQAEGGMQVVLGVGQLPDPLPVVAEHPEQHLAADAEGAAARQQRRAVGVEVGEVQVVVRIDQHERQHIVTRTIEQALCRRIRCLFQRIRSASRPAECQLYPPEKTLLNTRSRWAMVCPPAAWSM